MVIALTVILLLVIIVAVVYIFLIMPRVTDRADMDFVSTDYAHRGLWNEIYPENSIAAFAHAVHCGYGIELDVQLSRDGEIMVFHDYDLSRMCGVKKRLSSLSAAELSTLRLSGSAYTVPTLAEVLRLVDGKVPLLIEIKGEGKEEKLCRKLAEALDVYHGAFAIESFNPLVLSWFKNYRPRFARGQLVTKVTEVKGKKHGRLIGFMLSKMLLNVLSRPDFIAINGKMINSIAFRLCVVLFKCKGFAWTVSNLRQYRHCRRLGLFTIFEKIKP